MEYAEDFYMDHYRIDNGFVCLIDMDNREIYVATSGDVIYYLEDNESDELRTARQELADQQCIAPCFAVEHEVQAVIREAFAGRIQREVEGGQQAGQHCRQ